MANMTNREVIERYGRAITERDEETMAQLRHPDYVAEWPQSGERIRGSANARAIDENYPGGLGVAAEQRILGSEDRWVVTPVGMLLRVTGTGDSYSVHFTATYPGTDRPWQIAAFVELRDGKVQKETVIFGAPLEAPTWRSQWVERM